MKNKIALVLFMIPFIGIAQQYNAVSVSQIPAYEQLKQMDLRVPEADFDAKQLTYTDAGMLTTEVFKTYFPELQSPQTGVVVVFQRKSKLGSHYTLQQTYKGIPVYKATAVISVNSEGKLLSSFNGFVSTSDWSAQPFAVNEKMGRPFWVASLQTPIPAYQKTVGTQLVITDINGNAIAQKEGIFNYMADDTLVAGKVFLPDPLTSQQVIYGQDGTYKHFNDSDYALLNDQRRDVVFPVTFANGEFTMENQYAKLTDLQAPNITPVTSTVPVFDYLRSDHGFKETMVMYHLFATQQYYQSLGFDELKNYQIKVDAHSSTGDNSSFNYASDSSLNFGTGGIPDAEDGDVISHEYTHALSWFLNPTPDMNNERRAIEEAMCDVIAATLSRKYTGFNWRLLYNFDAPNPVASGSSKYWAGRTANSAKTYLDYSGSPYSDAEIWSSTMLDIAEAVGNDTAVLLMLHTIYSMPENCTMPQAAILYMNADSILFNKAFGWKAGPIFNARKLGNFPTGLSEQSKILRQVTIRNSAGFAAGEGDAIIDLPFNATYTITDIQGKTRQVHQSNGKIILHSQDFIPGMYIITIQSEGGQGSLKFIRN